MDSPSGSDLKPLGCKPHVGSIPTPGTGTALQRKPPQAKLSSHPSSSLVRCRRGRTILSSARPLRTQEECPLAHPDSLRHPHQSREGISEARASALQIQGG